MGDAVARTWKAGEAKGARESGVMGVVTSKLRQVRPLTGGRTVVSRKHSPGAIKMTLPSATQIPGDFVQAGRYRQSIRRPFRVAVGYRRHREEGMARLSAEGVKYIQIDAPRYSSFWIHKWRDWIGRK